jgi:hypothetical protein
MGKYRRKPIVFEAVQFINPNARPVGVVRLGCDDYRIATLEGEMRVTPGDWIVTGIKGEKWAVKPDVFEATYEAVSE